jgi:DNA-binding MarR family transcriptional regulator
MVLANTIRNEVLHMDYKEIANEFVLDMLQNSNNNKADTDLFSSGELRMLGSLLMFKDGMTAGELSQKMNLTTARVAQILNALEKKEQLYRKAESSDKRLVNAYLTEQGKEYAQSRYDTFVSFVSRLFEQLGEADTREYLRLTNRVKSISQEIGFDFKV